MKRMPKKYESPEKFNKALMICWKLFMLIIFVVCIVSVLTAYIQEQTDVKAEILERYYNDSFDRAFTKEQVYFLNDMARDVDSISSGEKNSKYSAEELEYPLLYGEEFETLTGLYRELMNEYNADSDRLDTQANKALESSDPEKYIKENEDKIQDSKVIPAVVDDIRKEYYAILESRNIDTTMLKEQNILDPGGLVNLDNSTLKKYISNLKDVESVEKNTVGLNDPYVTTYENREALVFPEKMNSSFQKILTEYQKSESLEGDTEIDKIYMLKSSDGSYEWRLQLLEKSDTEEHEYDYERCAALLVSEFNTAFEKAGGDFYMAGDIYIDVTSSIDNSLVGTYVYNPESRDFYEI